MKKKVDCSPHISKKPKCFSLKHHHTFICISALCVPPILSHNNIKRTCIQKWKFQKINIYCSIKIILQVKLVFHFIFLTVSIYGSDNYNDTSTILCHGLKRPAVLPTIAFVSSVQISTQ